MQHWREPEPLGDAQAFQVAPQAQRQVPARQGAPAQAAHQHFPRVRVPHGQLHFVHGALGIAVGVAVGYFAGGFMERRRERAKLERKVYGNNPGLDDVLTAPDGEEIGDAYDEDYDVLTAPDGEEIGDAYDEDE